MQQFKSGRRVRGSVIVSEFEGNECAVDGCKCPWWMKNEWVDEVSEIYESLKRNIC